VKIRIAGAFTPANETIACLRPELCRRSRLNLREATHSSGETGRTNSARSTAYEITLGLTQILIRATLADGLMCNALKPSSPIPRRARVAPPSGTLEKPATE